jgi:phosphoglycolate phosphatase
LLVQTVGFDLDMTLVDSSQAILLTTQQVLRSFNAEVDEVIIARSVGLPIKESFKVWVGDQYQQAYESYVDLYQTSGYLKSHALPGAQELLGELVGLGIKVVVITAKNRQSAEIQLRHLELPYSELVGGAFQEGKTEAMLKTGCIEFVGDHIEDFKAAVKAGIHFIGVTTNPMQNLERDSQKNFPLIESLENFWDYSVLRQIS